VEFIFSNPADSNYKRKGVEVKRHPKAGWV
jgi:hypothetical protein